MIILFEFIVPDLTFLLPGLLPGCVGEGDVLPGISPLHVVSPVGHLLAEILPARCLCPDVQDCQGNILDIGLDFAVLCGLQELVGFLGVGGCFLPVLAMEGLPLLADRQLLLPTELVGDLLHGRQLRLSHSEFVAVQHIHGVHDDVVMDVILVDVGHNQHLEVLELGAFLGPGHTDGVGLLRCDFLVLMPVLGEVLVRPASGLAVQLLHGLHFVLAHLRIAMDAGDQTVPGLFWVGHVVDGPAYTSSRSDRLNCCHVSLNSSCSVGSSPL